MTPTELIVLIIAFIIPSLYQRIRFEYNRSHFETLNLIRQKSALDIHHGHYGLIYIFITSMWLIFADKNIYIIALAGLGWGLLMDEIIPSIRMPAKDRPLELAIYKSTLKPTIILLSSVIILFIVLFFVV